MSEKFTVKFADSEKELLAAKRLRCQMFTEYNGDAANEQNTDYSSVDEQALHIIATDNESGEVVGYYRMLTTEAVGSGKFICEDEYNIDELKSRGEKMCELSRAIVKKEYRGGIVVMMLWKFILNYALDNGYRYLIGDVSFNGTDRNEFLQEVSYLAHNFGIDESYKITSRDVLAPMELLDESQYDKVAAVVQGIYASRRKIVLSNVHGYLIRQCGFVRDGGLAKLQHALHKTPYRAKIEKTTK